MKQTHIVQRPSSEEVAMAARDWFVGQCHHAVRERGKCVVALSGGGTPKRMYELLADIHGSEIDWPNVHMFMGDERDVPPDHVDSNYRMVKRSLLDRLKGYKPHVYRIPTGTQTPDIAAREYELAMREFARGSPFHFDIVLLGLGDDAHTASLFPETIALSITDRWVVANPVPKLSTTRVTMTAPILNSTRHLAFLVCGSKKQWAIDRIRSPKRNPNLFPAQLIQPAGDLWWFLDEGIQVQEPENSSR